MSAPAVGEERSAVVVDGLHRTQIMMYAGASGDYNAIHTDEVFAREVAGRPTVMAHGMLTMGLAVKVVTDWFPDGHVGRYRARFSAPVWPGDTLTAVATVREVDGDRAVLELAARNQDDVQVLAGEVTVVLAEDG